MRPALRAAALTFAGLFLVWHTAHISAADLGRVSGTAMDSSGALLPGVTVVVTSRDQRVLASATTDQKGMYTLEAVPAGPVDLRFELDGFAPAAIAFEVQPNTELRVNGRLDIAARAENVEVRAPASTVASIPPKPVLLPIPDHDRDAVCGPSKAPVAVESLGTVRSRLHESKLGMFGQGDELMIAGGTDIGLEVGRNLVTRRRFAVRGTSGKPLMGEHTSGLLQIVAADSQVSTAVVVYACDEILRDDYLAGFTPAPRITPEPEGITAFGAAAPILFADAGQIVGVPKRLMVLDKGSAGGLRTGQRVTIFRYLHKSKEPSIVGDAVVVSVREDSSTIRVERANDAIQFGDLAAGQIP
jgi:hypothetical protein